jgi:hypothetical protein
MKRILMWFIVAIVIVILAIAGVVFSAFLEARSQSQNSAPISGTQQQVKITEENFPQYLASTNLINDLPSDASILLKTEDKTYAVEKGTVTEGSLDNPDIIITLPSSYIPQISNGFCSTMQQANANGDLKFTLNIGSVSAAWKYRSLMKYKSCLGI